jgi:hypothetical protein
MLAETKFYCWSGSLRLVVAARSPFEAAQQLVQFGFDCNRLAELEETISVGQTGFAEATSRFNAGPVLASIEV